MSTWSCFLRRLTTGSLLSTISVSSKRCRLLGLPASNLTQNSRTDWDIGCRRQYAATADHHKYVFRQLFDRPTFAFTYLLADPDSREAVLIDPIMEQADRDLTLVKQLGLNLIYGINTHVHSDHVTGTGTIKRQLPSFKSIISKMTPAKADMFVVDGDIIKFGKFQLECRSTPGHSNGCMTLVWHEMAMAFTGDTLLIRKCGATKQFTGDASKLYKSVHERIFTLPEHFLILPGHDYHGLAVSTVAEEKQWNLRFKKPLNEFVELMNEIDDLPRPQINIIPEEMLAANITDGQVE